MLFCIYEGVCEPHPPGFHLVFEEMQGSGGAAPGKNRGFQVLGAHSPSQNGGFHVTESGVRGRSPRKK